MSYNKPSQRRTKKRKEALNLVPILDAVFILIFYLLMSAEFFKTYQVKSDYPVVSEKQEKIEKDSLELFLVLKKNFVEIRKGNNEELVKTLSYKTPGYLNKLNELLFELKKKYPTETFAVVNPDPNLSYKILISTLDFIKSRYEGEKVIQDLFPNIVFGNIDEESDE